MLLADALKKQIRRLMTGCVIAGYVIEQYDF